jgi:hypothetical protein
MFKPPRGILDIFERIEGYKDLSFVECASSSVLFRNANPLFRKSDETGRARCGILLASISRLVSQPIWRAPVSFDFEDVDN